MAMPSSSYDVVILGSGIAGLAGALAAHELGLQSVVLEKAAALGGGTVHSYGLIWVGQNYLARDAGISDSHDEVLAYMRFLGGGAVDEARLAAFVARSPEVLKFFVDCGIRFRLVRGVTDHYYEKAPGSHAVGRTVEAELISGVELGDWRDRVLVPHDVPCFVTAEEQIAWGGINSASHWDADLIIERRRQDMRGKGLGLICRFAAALRERGVPMLTTQPVARLALDSGRVTGVVMGSGEFIAARRGVPGGQLPHRRALFRAGHRPANALLLGRCLLRIAFLDRRRPCPRGRDRWDRAQSREQSAGHAMIGRSLIGA
jgi:3-oxosteroid 1-dehydrogenase